MNHSFPCGTPAPAMNHLWVMALASLMLQAGGPFPALAASATLQPGQYTLSGTIGQPDAGGPLTNGVYSLTGGYWALPIAVQTTNAPTLAIIPAAPGWATISWTPPTPGFVLQETVSLAPSNWTNSPSGATNPITVLAVPPSKFYRLNKP